LRIAAEAAWLGRWELVPKTGTLTGDEVFGAQHGSPPGVHPDFEGHLEAIHPEDREEVRRRVAAAIGGRQGYEAEYRVPLPDGSTRWVLSHGRFIPGVDPDPDRLVGVTLDASGHHELERERELARARELTALAEAAERERISRELHDRVAHHMGVAHQSLELYSALKEAAPERAAERLKLARETTRLALDQTRSLSAELKRLQDEELAEGLEDAFVKLSESYVPEGVEMEVSLSGEESRVPKPTRTQAYLAMREAIRNAVRHSGCSRIEVNLRVEEGELFGLVEDDGEGFDPEAVRKATPSWGVGLRSMRERVEMLGGTLRVDSGPGAGTRAELRVPLDGWRP
jgi:signal transduction histidine kinase